MELESKLRFLETSALQGLRRNISPAPGPEPHSGFHSGQRGFPSSPVRLQTFAECSLWVKFRTQYSLSNGPVPQIDRGDHIPGVCRGVAGCLAWVEKRRDLVKEGCSEEGAPSWIWKGELEEGRRHGRTIWVKGTAAVKAQSCAEAGELLGLDLRSSQASVLGCLTCRQFKALLAG